MLASAAPRSDILLPEPLPIDEGVVARKAGHYILVLVTVPNYPRYRLYIIDTIKGVIKRFHGRDVPYVAVAKFFYQASPSLVRSVFSLLPSIRKDSVPEPLAIFLRSYFPHLASKYLRY